MSTHFKVLIVDDDLDDIRLVSDFLKEARRSLFLVDSIPTGEEAQKAVLQDYDIILMDYQLPDMTGLDLVLWMRENLNHTPVILITSHGDKRLQMEALDIGCSEYLEKGTFNSLLLERTILYAININNYKQGRTTEQGEPFKDLTQQVLKIKTLVEDLKKNQEEIEKSRWEKFKELLNWVTLHPMVALVGFILLMSLITLLVLLLQVLDVDKVQALKDLNSGLPTQYITT